MVAILAAPAVTGAWLPIAVGNQWVYQHDQRDAGPHGIPDARVERWKTEETIDRVTSVPEGTLVVERVRAYDHEMSKDWLPENDSTARVAPVQRLLVRNDCVYRLEPDAEPRDVVAHRVPAALCFPMTIGRTWGRPPDTTPDDDNEVWHVRAVNADPYGIAGVRTYRLFAWKGSGYATEMWFGKGIGVLQSDGEHHGTYWEERTQLLQTTIAGRVRRYTLAPARVIPLSEYDCLGAGWRHFVRADGHAFSTRGECLVNVGRGR